MVDGVDDILVHPSPSTCGDESAACVDGWVGGLVDKGQADRVSILPLHSERCMAQTNSPIRGGWWIDQDPAFHAGTRVATIEARPTTLPATEHG